MVAIQGVQPMTMPEVAEALSWPETSDGRMLSDEENLTVLAAIAGVAIMQLANLS